MLGFPHTESLNPNRRIDFENVETLKKLHVRMMLNRCMRMFKWNGLPESLPARFIEQNLLINGFVGIAETDKIRAYFGGMGGVLDEYYLPSVFIVANPWLKLNKEFTIYRDYHESEFNKKDDCIIGLNDTFSYGLYPLIEKYAIQLATNEITLNVADINSRAINILTATSDSAYNSIKMFLKDLIKGKIAHVRESMIQDNDVRSLPFNSQTNSGITNLIELQQYYKASFYNEIGLNANYNMKRESIQQNESDMNHDSLRPLIDDMLFQRKQLAEQINKCFGLNVSVEFDSIWAQRMLSEDAVIDQEIAAAENMEEAAEEPETAENPDHESAEPDADASEEPEEDQKEGDDIEETV